MPKMKTSRAAAKRFKVTGSGKLKRNKAYKSHILTKKTTKRKRVIGMELTAACQKELQTAKLQISNQTVLPEKQEDADGSEG